MIETKDTLAAYGHNWPVLGGKLAILMLMIVLFWYVMNWVVRIIDNRGKKIGTFDSHAVLFDGRNQAYRVWRLSLVVAQAIAILPVMNAPDGNVWLDMMWSVYEAAIVSLVLVVMVFVFDAVVLANVKNIQAITENSNMAIAITDGVLFIAAAVMLNGSLTGTAPTIRIGFESMAVFGLLGLLLVIGVYWLHEASTKISLRECIRDGNVTAAWNLAGIVIPVAIVSREGVAGDFTDWGDAFAGFAATVVIAISTLYLMRVLIDVFILRGRTMVDVQRESQVGAAATLAVMMTGLAVLEASGVRAIL